MMWYFQAQDGEQSGPYDLDAILSRIRSRQIRRHTLVWTHGMPDWHSADKLPQLSAALDEAESQPPPLPNRPLLSRLDSAQGENHNNDLDQQAKTNWSNILSRTNKSNDIDALRKESSDSYFKSQDFYEKTERIDAQIINESLDIALSPLATPWSRYWARTIDLALVIPFSAFIVAFIIMFFAALAGYEDNLFAEPRYQLILLPPSIMLGCLFLAMFHMIFGNTIGKKIYGIRVRKLMGSEDRKFWLIRELRVSAQGLFLGIPFLALISMLLQFHRVIKNKPASYDFAFARVIQKPISRLRFFSGILFALLLLFTLSVLDAIV